MSAPDLDTDDSATGLAPRRGRAARHPWWIGPAAWLGALLVRVLGATWRVDRRGLDAFDARLAAGERCVFAVWHARLLPLVYTHRHRAIVVLISHHHDGELIARIIEQLGFHTARGSSTRGGEEGARDLLRYAAEGSLIGITPDGPRGPAERVKPGLAWLASHTGWPVVPIASAARRAWVFRSWDRFRAPQPFARVVVSYGEPIPIPGDADDAALEAWRGQLEAALAALTQQVRRQAGEEDA